MLEWFQIGFGLTLGLIAAVGLLALAVGTVDTIDWLLYGEDNEKGSFETLAEHAPERYEVVRPEPVQVNLLYEVELAVLSYIKEYKKNYDLKRLVRLKADLYNHCRQDLERPTPHLAALVKFLSAYPNRTPEQIKAEAVKKFDEFWAVFVEWAEKHGGQRKTRSDKGQSRGSKKDEPAKPESTTPPPESPVAGISELLSEEQGRRIEELLKDPVA
jgi:hypothetical protein